MLNTDDLDAFVQCFAAAQNGKRTAVPGPPSKVLRADDGLFSAELWRLLQSLKIAAVLQDAPRAAVLAARLIFENLGDVRCLPLSHFAAWEEAIAWALLQAAAIGSSVPDLNFNDRQHQVGLACARLRSRGFDVKVKAYGPELAPASQKAIVERADSLVGLVGGMEAIERICAWLRQKGRWHDGLWLFGNRVPGMYESKAPEIPYGWLLSLGIRHIARPGTARKPDTAWQSVVELATDFAAFRDCQRYHQAEEWNLAPVAFHRVFADSLTWRELFALPQVPARVLPLLWSVLKEVLVSEPKTDLGLNISDLFGEIENVIQWSAEDRPTRHVSATLQRRLPLLWRLGRGVVGQVNSRYADPFAANERNQDALILFGRGRSEIITLPRSMVAAAACEVVFRLIWNKLEGKHASKIVGATIERAVEHACKGKAPIIIAHQDYRVGKERFELDVATREEDHIVLFEAKDKSLTT
jgi:hypothetical protein